MRQCYEENGECFALKETSQVPSIWLDKRIIIIIISATLFSTGLTLELIFPSWRLFADALILATAVISGYSVAKEGVFSLIFRKKVNIDLLITTAAVGSFFIGHGEEGAAVLFLFYIAEFLEDHAGERARKSITSLMKLAPEVATVKREGKEVQVPLSEVDINEIIVVKPGEKIPLDGKVINGISSVNQASITGESMPVLKKINDEVYAGTLNNEGFLEIKVTKRSDETVLSRIIKLVEEAQKMKSPTEKFIDKFSKYYTPSVMFLAITVATIPTFMFSLPFDEWIYKALVLLVISCPCALAISTPVAMVSGITNAAKNGVLIKGSTYVEETSKVKVFAFDKTGTLTEGMLEVANIIGLEYSRKDILVKAASIEALSEHPIAEAIVEEAKREGIKLETVRDFQAIFGKGAMGKIGQETFYVGNRKLFEKASIKFPEKIAEKLETEGKTVVFVGNGKKVMGLIAVADKIRDTAINAIAELQKSGIKTVMITGDNERTAKAVANRIGITEYQAELLPEDKVNAIRKLSRKYGHVAMVGDGVNDAPALASSTVGIAMGAIGSDASLENADIALMQDDLSRLPYLIKLSKKTLKIVKENVLAALLIKGSFAVLAFPGLITLWLAVAIGDMGLSLAVILNAMRISTVKPLTSLTHKTLVKIKMSERI